MLTYRNPSKHLVLGKFKVIIILHMAEDMCVCVRVHSMIYDVDDGVR